MQMVQVMGNKFHTVLLEAVFSLSRQAKTLMIYDKTTKAVKVLPTLKLYQNLQNLVLTVCNITSTFL